MSNEMTNEGTVTEGTAGDATDADALLSRLRVIEDQPLEARATAFTQLHEELQARLEGGDAPASHA